MGGIPCSRHFFVQWQVGPTFTWNSPAEPAFCIGNFAFQFNGFSSSLLNRVGQTPFDGNEGIYPLAQFANLGNFTVSPFLKLPWSRIRFPLKEPKLIFQLFHNVLCTVCPGQLAARKGKKSPVRQKPHPCTFVGWGVLK